MMDLEGEIKSLKERISALESTLKAILKAADANVIVRQHREFVERIRAGRDAEAQ